MDNQLLNNQVYFRQQQVANHLQQPPAQSQNYGANTTKENAKEAVANNTNAGYIASKFDVMQHPLILLKNTILGLGTAIGITQLGNYLVKGKIKEGATHAETLQQAPLIKLGKKIDGFIQKTPFLRKTLQKASDLKAKITNKPKHEIFKEIGKQYKQGSKVTWSMGKFYEEGKGSEALDEFVEFLQRSPEDAFKNKSSKDAIDSILKDVKTEKLSKSQAARKIIEGNLLDDVKASHLDKLKLGSSKGFGAIVDKLFGTTPNLNTALAKAKFFNGMKTGLGPISRTFNKLSLMMMEGVGGGVLGGKAAMFMSVFGLISAFNACTKANVAKKEKEKRLQEGNLDAKQFAEMQKKPWSGEMTASFMEDFAGFTLGGYLMTFPLGVGLNKVLGLANLGRDNKAVQAAANKLGVQATDKVYQNTVIKYNDMLKQDKLARDYISYLEGGQKPGIMQKIKKAIGLSNEQSMRASMVEKLKLKVPPDASKESLIEALRTKTKSAQWFKEHQKIIKQAGKSQLTLKSIFKGSSVNKGTKMERLGRYLLQKPLELAAKILGPDKFMTYSVNSANRLKKFVNVGGGVGRILLVGMVLTVPFRNAFMKASNKIFGKPSFSQYDEVKGVYDEKEDGKKEGPVIPSGQLAEAPKLIKLPAVEPTPILQHQNNNTEVIKPKTPVYQQQEQISEANPYNRSLDTYTYVPKNEVIQNPVRDLDTYKYVPKA